jgi:hypothetical protein
MTSMMSPVEQNKLKRSGVGLRACDRDRAFDRFTLFAPQNGGGKVYLIDLEGTVVHSWQMPYPPGNSAYLTEKGDLLLQRENGKGADPVHQPKRLEGRRGIGSRLERPHLMGSAPSAPADP